MGTAKNQLAKIKAWIRQEENMYLTTPPPVAAKLPQVVQELIGSSICLGNFMAVSINAAPGNIYKNT